MQKREESLENQGTMDRDMLWKDIPMLPQDTKEWKKKWKEIYNSTLESST